MADPEIDVVALTKTYFEVWNSHDEAALRGLHADASSLHDWDATHGPTNAAVAAGVRDLESGARSSARSLTSTRAART